MNILILDNFDSFTFNLYQCVGEILVNNNKNFAIDVARNNEITIEKIKKITTKKLSFHLALETQVILNISVFVQKY